MGTKPKASSLAFAANRTSVEIEPVRRNSGETVQCTVRLLRDDWARLRVLAVSENANLQAIIVAALSIYVQKKGLPPLTPYNNGDNGNGG